jgi:formylglycine-generating enzyme required for sulfatase activity/CubicO group peptidase (beta-lactamase class C family)/pimeloyl-ACP methyl ester carboxylesterase/predicted small lipoprotein YifL
MEHKTMPLLMLLAILFSITACGQGRTLTPAPGERVDESATQSPVIQTGTQQNNPSAIEGKFNVGGYELYLHCLGTGTPTVIFEAGANDVSETWSLVLPEVAQFTQACAYDRAGLGQSEPGPEPRDSYQIIKELHALLTAAHIEGPYVLVGHSLGGMYMRLFADEYQEEVVGLVLVDSEHIDQFECFAAVLPPELPDESESLRFYREWFTNPATYPELSHVLFEPGSLGDMPLAVLTSPHKERAADLPAGLSDSWDAIWVELQEEWAQISSRSTQIIADGSGHFIQLDQPDLVIDAIRLVVEGAQEAATATLVVTGEPNITTTPTWSPSIQLAKEGVSTNAAWTPVVQEFDRVEMVLVPAGCFMMGSTEEVINAAYEVCRSASAMCETDKYGLGWFSGELPPHEICFSEPFWIDRYEVTNAQFRLFSGQAAEESHWTGDNRPRETLNWFEADALCQLRGARLPTEAEWEYAARGPDSLIYPWGNDFVADNVIYAANANGQTAQVGSRPGGASWVGALDMSGNVAEWMNSLLWPYPYDATDGRETSPETTPRAIRNSSWNNWDLGMDDTSFLRAAYRSGMDSIWGNSSLGFRCTRSAGSQTLNGFDEYQEAGNYTPLPGEDWKVSTPAEQGLDPMLVADLYANATKPESLYGLLLIKNGYLIAESYFNGGGREQITNLASMTKSYISALVGIALDQGCMSSVDQKMMDFFPEFADQITDPRKEQITIGDMLAMRSGYPWEAITPPYGDLLYSSNDLWLPHIVDFPLTSDPGTEFAYSNLTAHLLGIIVARACGTDLLTFGQQYLFSPMNARVGLWWSDADGYYKGDSRIYLTARDAAKLGLLYINHGEYEGNRIFSADWVSESLQAYSDGIYGNHVGNYLSDIGYGYLWWSAKAGNHHFYYAWGAGGNLIILLDELNMVIVITADFAPEVLWDSQAWEKEKAIIDLVGQFIASLPGE